MYALTSVYARYPNVRSKKCACAENIGKAYASRMTFDRLVSPPKNEPVRMRTSICGRGQKIGISSVQTMLEKKGRYGATVECKWRKFSETTPRPHLFTPPIFLRILSDSVISRSYSLSLAYAFATKYDIL